MHQLEGRNPVLEALRAGRPINKIIMARQSAAGPILGLAHQNGVPVVRVEAAALDRMAKTRKHQGVIALTAAKEYTPLPEMLAAAAASGHQPLLLLLDGVTDPQNLGALIRTAEAMGVDGIVLPERRAAGLTPVVEASSAGALTHVCVSRVTNLTRTMSFLKDQGYWIVGAEAGTGCYEVPELDRPAALVLGGEDTGLHRLVKEECDFLVSIPMFGRINSLNVSAAGAILLASVARRIRTAPHPDSAGGKSP